MSLGISNKKEARIFSSDNIELCRTQLCPFSYVKKRIFKLKRAKIKTLILIFFVFSSFLVFGQRDTKFWFVAPEVSNGHGDRPIFFRLSTIGSGGEVTISQPANPDFDIIYTSIPANGMVSINLTDQIDIIENKPANTILNYGLLLTSDSPFSAYYEVATSNNPDIFPLKGRNALGEDFWIPGQENWPNIYGKEAIDIVATEDNTSVTITPTIDIEGHTGNLPFTITLNRGETYSCEAVSSLSEFSLSGTHITSDKPIAITISDDSIGPSSNYDIIGDQIVPIDLLNDEYIVIRGYAFQGSNNYERVYVLAVKNDTEIYLNGSTTPTTTIQQGEQFEIDFTENSVYIAASKNVYIYHLSGIGREFGSAIIPPIACTGSQQISFVRNSAGEFDLFIFTKTENIGDFVLNGGTTFITADKFSPVTGATGISYMRERDIGMGIIPTGNNIIENSGGKFHMGILNNMGGSAEYGFFSDFASLNLGPDVLICKGSSHIFDAGPYVDSYLWNTGATIQTITVSDSGNYWVEVVDNLCELSDTVHLGWYPTVHSSIPRPEATTCEASPITLDAGADFQHYLWSDNSNGRYYTTEDAGIVWVEVTENNSCVQRDSTTIIVNPRPAAQTIRHH